MNALVRASCTTGGVVAWLLAGAIGLGACGPAPDDATTEQRSSALQTPVPSVAGLPGSYQRVSTVTGERMVSMTLGPLDSQSDGPYVRILSARSLPYYSLEQGTYHAIPNNPAIGFASLLFEPTQGAVSAYIIDGILGDPLGRIVTLQLERIAPDQGPPFLLQRVF